MSKVLFFDIDGTLIHPFHGVHEIPQTVKAELKRLKDEGNYLFIATGRPKAFIPDELLNVGFSGFILCNGAYIEMNNQAIYEQPLNHSQLVQLIRLLEDNHIEYFLETSDYVYIDKRFKELDALFQTFDIAPSKFKHNFDLAEQLKRTLKLELHTMQKNGAFIEEFIKNDFSYDNHGTQDAYEIYSKVDSKASAIQKVLDYLHISIENSYAFGDGLNDMEMIQYVGHGIAMENACQQLKDVADEICGAIDQDGLAKYLKTI